MVPEGQRLAFQTQVHAAFAVAAPPPAERIAACPCAECVNAWACESLDTLVAAMVTSPSAVATLRVLYPDYAALARSSHAYGERVEDPTELPAAIDRGLAAVQSGQAAVLDVVLTPI